MEDDREHERERVCAPPRSNPDERCAAPSQLQLITQARRIYFAHHHHHHHRHHHRNHQEQREQASNELLIGCKTRTRRPGARTPSPGLERKGADGEERPRVENDHKRRRPSQRGSSLRECLFSKLLLLVCLAALFTTSLQQQQQQEFNSFTQRRALSAGLEPIRGRLQSQQTHQETNSSALQLTSADGATRGPSNEALGGPPISSEPNLSSTSSDRRGQPEARDGQPGGPPAPATHQLHNHAHSDHHSDGHATSEPAARPIPRQLTKRAPAPPSTLAGPGGSGSWKQQQSVQQQQQQQYLLSRITDADLLPLSDFTVEQPAFSDIMRTWPPTTSKQLLQAGSSSGASKLASSSRQRQRHRPDQQANFGQRAPSSSGLRKPAAGSSPAASFFERITFQEAQGADEPAGWVRNHLNEDFDDTILTADESFEQDQLPEPPTWVNYLGELADFIYLQLRQFYDSSPRSPFGNAASSTAGASSQPPARGQQPLQAVRFEAIEDLLDDFYYDQYENNQVLYYGPQLVREGDTFEIGCYLPNEQPAEWTKSGKPLAALAADESARTSPNGSASALYALSPLNNPLRVIKRSNFMGAKQNFSLKVFEAQLSDTGSYRCNRLSRKYHKLIVVPAKISAQQLYLIQQKLLSIVAPGQVSSQISAQQIQLAALHASLRANSPAAGPSPRPTIQASGDSLEPGRSGRRGGSHTGSGGASTNQPARSLPASAGQLLPGYVLIEGQPMIVSCNISDEFILRRLRELPHFQLAWYKNGKLLRNSQLPLPNVNSSSASSQTSTGLYTSSGLARQQQQQQGARAGAAEEPHQQPHQQSTNRPAGSQRVQFLGPNGRQMYIAAANYADAADYLCSWSRLPARQQPSGESDESDSEHDSSTTSAGQQTGAGGQQINSNPLAAGNLHQLVAPVKLRPFKSAYHVRQRNQLRLVCQVQRGYPPAQVSWYVGNQLVDGDFLRSNPEFRVLQLEARPPGGRQLLLRASGQFEGEPGAEQQQQQQQQQPAARPSQEAGPDEEEPQMVEINPIPAGRQQMQLTANGRGQWIEYRKLAGDKYAIDTAENQLRYLQIKLAQLTGTNVLQASAAAAAAAAAPAVEQAPVASSSLLSQASLSVLVVSNLQPAKHTSRYACRATSRANTDEVTTVIRVKDTSTTVIKPHGGAATLIPGQSLHFECSRVGQEHAEFKWYKRTLTAANAHESAQDEPSSAQQQRTLLEPNTDDNIQIHNERLTLVKPGYEAIGDYICQSLSPGDKSELAKEFGVIKVRAQPYIDDFGLAALSHTGKSATVTEGERLEMSCHIRDPTVPVEITWLRSELADDERHMVSLAEVEAGAPSREPNSREEPLLAPTYQSAGDVIVERVDNFTKRLVIESVRAEHRGHYACMVDNHVTERSRKTVFIRVKDNIVALWPFLGILAELFILFTIIYVWETQRAQKAILAPAANSNKGSAGAKRPASGPTSAFENVPLNR